ncbi:Ribosomal large subunit pseudouridine synthase B [Symbiodinium microadriaticum]|uniref:Ribosomal large subunit pseudouridine synthase B n=1 Tax=Symbiodinium microadriaticum TaxID=2951 RepID=A0A1Q9CNP7_SYMMI|nr:Ribosomal large subunit pseudouridine synthase B [Symbiodinium microadriaticum]
MHLWCFAAHDLVNRSARQAPPKSALARRCLSLEKAADVSGVPRPLSFLLPRRRHCSNELQQYVFAEDVTKPEELGHDWDASRSMADVLAQADGWLYGSIARSPLLALWKPRGVITTMSPEEPNNLKQFLESLPHLDWPTDRPPQHVGRLDKTTSGLLLLTDNGDVSRILRAPQGIRKTYIATAALLRMAGSVVQSCRVNKPSATKEQLRRLEDGIDIGEGPPARALTAAIVGEELVCRGPYCKQPDLPAMARKVKIKVEIDEGRNRVVRRMFHAVGLPLRSLHREAIGQLSCRQLGLRRAGSARQVPPGQVLELLASSSASSGERHVHGRAIYNALRCGSLLCNLRRGGARGLQDPSPCGRFGKRGATTTSAPVTQMAGIELDSRRPLSGVIPAVFGLPRPLCLRGRGIILVDGTFAMRVEVKCIQIAKVSRDGSTILNLAFGHVAYTSWQPLHPTDAFPLHGTAFMATLVTASTAHALRQKGISLSAPVASLLWTKFPAPSGTTVGEVLSGAGPWSQAPAAPSARRLADLQEMLKWLETAPPASGSCPSWWPATAHATVCAALLRKVGRTPSEALQSFFSQASRPFFKATQSPVQISKPILSVESAEVEASQDALVASLGADDMRCMHLADGLVSTLQIKVRAILHTLPEM